MRGRSRNWYSLAAIAGLALLVAAVTQDVAGPPQQTATPAPPNYTPPPDRLNPASAAIRPTGTAWVKYLEQPPLTVGTKAPRISVTDAHHRHLELPETGKPSIWMVLCGCNDCRVAGGGVMELVRGLVNPPRTVVFVTTSSDYVWDRMGASYDELFDLVWDKKAKYYEHLRAPGTEYSRLPMVWGIDRTGRVAFFDRPERHQQGWVKELAKALGVHAAPAAAPYEVTRHAPAD